MTKLSLYPFFFSQVKELVLKSGTILEADVVIAGVGNSVLLQSVGTFDSFICTIMTICATMPVL